MKKTSSFMANYNSATALALAIQVYEKQGFIRSGEGYSQFDEETGEITVKVEDNKTEVNNLMKSEVQPSESQVTEAQKMIDKFNGKFMIKKLTGTLTSFEQNVNKAFNEDLNKFSVSIIASIPHMNNVDIKRKKITERIESVRFDSEFIGELRKRYDLTIEVLDVKFIQSTGVYMITGLHKDKNIIKFWWRDQPDISDLINGKTVTLRGTVNKHEDSKYSNAKETMFNRVKIS